jgi:exo-beta-1,3-glucanase (GH17 family)/cellulose synthase/poly-beta-1,6-N-acetylglucosamine synthase-like glycosyltransferase
MKRKRYIAANLIISAAVAVLCATIWSYLNRPEQEPPWPSKVPGFSFSPMRADHNPIEHILPSVEQISEDLALLKGKAHAVRTYSVEGPLVEIPALASQQGLNVALGAWIGDNLQRNEQEIQKVIELAQKYRNVVRVIVGNEVMLRNDIPLSTLTGYLDRVRNALAVPVSTAEPWHVWIRHTQLAEHVDFLAVHMLPYWEGIDVDHAVDYIFSSIDTLQTAFPGKPVVVGEVGWPSNGRVRRAAVASPANEAIFLRRFIARAGEEKLIYYIMEAFDQPWKMESEGKVGAYWGVYDVERKPKFNLTEPIIGIPHWHILAAISIVVAMVLLTFLLSDSETMRGRGRSFLAVLAFAASSVAVWVVYDLTHQYLTLSGVIVGIVLIIGMVGVITVLFTEAHEWAEVLWVTGRRRLLNNPAVPDDALPMVSIHIPAYNEPPEMLMATLDAAAALDYPRYEVLVIDNNTKDPAVWQPVMEHCQKLGPRFRFFHVDPLEGFKAGALNYALGQTSAEASIVAVIDSDYVVERSWLRDLVPPFENPRIAIVQAPQDYRDSGQNAFKAVCYNEYSGFFFTGMISRNERNAIIQHGTLTLIRRSVLQEVGGWAEWCITEDAELGLRIFEHGHEALYIPRSYGRGLMPDTFIDYKKQRFRWAYGAVQIMRRHARALSGLQSSKLTLGQRYHFIAGWLPWLADGFNFIFTLCAIIWSLAMIFFPKAIDPPLVVFSALPLAYVIFKGAKTLNLYHAQAGATVLQTFAATLAGLSLTHTIGRGVLRSFLGKKLAFFRTPKMAESHAMLRALASAKEETLLMILLWFCAAGVIWRHGSDSFDMFLWVIVLLTQSLPYTAALTLSLLSAFPRIHFYSIASGNLIRSRL